MNVGIIGAGYVGLVTGVCLAEIGHDVVCVDVDESKIEKLRNGEIPIYEPGLDVILQKAIKQNKIKFTTSIAEATEHALVMFIAVGTPSKENGDADLNYVENCARQIAENMTSYKLVVEKSTVPAQTGNRIQRTIQMALPKKYQADGEEPIDFDVASNPEFLREGSAVEDFMNPDRVVIGVKSNKAEELLREIYAPLKPTMVVTDINSAELIKHASNSFLATKISFINAVSKICEHVGGDIEKVAEGMGFDKRIGRSFLNAGVGYGGSCFPKDVEAFIRLSEKSGYDFTLLKEVRNINDAQKQSFIKLIEDKLWIIKNKTIGILGLAFKPDTDDMRSAASITIIQALQSEGAKIKAYDPEAENNAKKIFNNIEYSSDPYDLSKDCDCLILMTEWAEFKDLDFAKIKKLVKQPIVFDGRNFYNPKDLRSLGFEYHSIGRS